MTSFWSAFVVVITLGSIAATFMLLHVTRRHEIPDGEQQQKDHSFDGIAELESPLPRWWYWMFVVSIVFSVGYLVLFPGLGNFPGLLNWTSFGEHEQDRTAAVERFGGLFTQLAQVPVDELSHDKKARKIGQRLFGVHCAQCHGEGGRGNFGFPNLADRDWLWGESPDAVVTSIAAGRNGVMPSWGAALGESGLADVTQHVLSLSQRRHDAAAAARGSVQYQMFCVACHGANGGGDDQFGTPDLTDDDWQYGGSPEEIAFTIRHGRSGVMPAHTQTLEPEKIHVLAAYVIGLRDQSPR